MTINYIMTHQVSIHFLCFNNFHRFEHKKHVQSNFYLMPDGKLKNKRKKNVHNYQ